MSLMKRWFLQRSGIVQNCVWMLIEVIIDSNTYFQMKSLGCHHCFVAERRYFKIILIGVIVQSIGVNSVTIYALKNNIDFPSKSVILIYLTYMVMIGAHSTGSYLFVVFLWCIKKRFQRLNEYMRSVYTRN